ncbi:hypothetical protein Stsp01_64150 [Streptomyces sp. NBRC 13847]|nr:hypothetical protein Stsp01_64150 [Streptomyces sp. NBRC 13847]
MLLSLAPGSDNGPAAAQPVAPAESLARPPTGAEGRAALRTARLRPPRHLRELQLPYEERQLVKSVITEKSEGIKFCHSMPHSFTRMKRYFPLVDALSSLSLKAAYHRNLLAAQ